MNFSQKEMGHSESLRQTHRNQIRPIFEMLKHKKSELNNKDWEKLVSTTKQSIIKSPHEYLSIVPDEQVTDSAIHYLFEQFLNESSQSSFNLGEQMP